MIPIADQRKDDTSPSANPEDNVHDSIREKYIKQSRALYMHIQSKVPTSIMTQIKAPFAYLK